MGKAAARRETRSRTFAAIHSSALLAASTGVLVYLAVPVAVEWLFSPRDLRFATDMLRRYLPSSTRNA